MKREIILISFGLFFIMLGAFLMLRYKSLTLPLSKPSLLSAFVSPSLPKFISIPSAKINAEVASGGYKDNKWILDDNYVLFLPTSAKLGEGGNTILYAHNREGLFGNLKKASYGDVIVLSDANGKKYKYSIYSIEWIKPYETEKINTYEKDTITLFTCDGWFDEKRLVVKAKIIKVDSTTSPLV